MKITFLGTCSGTEPMPGRGHVSLAVEAGGGVYFFDAGEGCSRTAYLSGIDLLATRAIFISHAHFDHVGGLAGLLWTMVKLIGIAAGRGEPNPLGDKTVPLFLPHMDLLEGLRQLLLPGGGEVPVKFDLAPREMADGEIFSDGCIRVEALHNTHMGTPAAGRPWRSFSLRIEADAKASKARRRNRAVVYSGDVAGIEELTALIGDGCDLLIMETGHHLVEDVCRFLLDGKVGFGRLVFNHHGREVLADPDGERRKAERILGQDVLIADDGMTLTL